jgi:hypothetical protein
MKLCENAKCMLATSHFFVSVMQPEEPSGHIPGLARRRLCQEVKNPYNNRVCLYLLPVKRSCSVTLTLNMGSMWTGCSFMVEAVTLAALSTSPHRPES